ncbi:hydantoinase/oxoprolinase family protein [Methylocystis heyeri]|uniref:H4MPT-linked C1 transfer pathway protein n=1 Tax=Methylocystis heyeri TaxID=391905 RepID=A0A6B8KGZ2_9HYPH|nr:hydantoinase/oxoprolinase family protein [Methylocystis heyeri]QGM46879.1 H4MPT-linked C1 transfer pathway protein [Methylocystis heyeri]
MSSVVGWDIGGANLKAARAEDGVIVAVTQRPCAPHLGLAHLEEAIRAAAQTIGAAPRHAVTMTAELSDAFENRARGVASIAAIFSHELSGAEIRFYAGAKGFVAKAQLAEAAAAVASANWRASAELVARHCEKALFIDMGSTTTDIIPIRDQAISALGDSDATRLQHGELAYAGLLRGAPATGVAQAPFAGRWTALVDESFATIADVHRILGNIPPGLDTVATVDGRPKSVEASRARLARLVGLDLADASPAQWDALARFFATVQMRRIEDQIVLLASRATFVEGAPVVGAGIGRRLVAGWAERTGRAYRSFDEFVPATPEAKAAAGDCAPACAVALLAGEF